MPRKTKKVLTGYKKKRQQQKWLHSKVPEEENHLSLTQLFDENENVIAVQCPKLSCNSKHGEAQQPLCENTQEKANPDSTFNILQMPPNSHVTFHEQHQDNINTNNTLLIANPPSHNYNLRRRKVVQTPSETCTKADTGFKIALTNARNVKVHDLGKMSHKCEFCYAYHFLAEKTGSNEGFTMCCQKGKVELEPIQHSDVMQKYLTGKMKLSAEYKNNIRSYNSALAMASTMVSIVDNDRGGIPFFKIHDQVYHGIGGLIPNPGQKAMYNQLYVYDVDAAVRQRMSHPANSSCSEIVMADLSNYIAKVNPYAKSFKSMHVAVQAQTSKNKITDLCMYIVEDKSQDHRRFNLPKADTHDVAVIFKSDDGAPPVPKGLYVYPFSGGITTVPPTHPALDPLAFPLLFPHGDLGWTYTMVHNMDRATKVQNKLTLREYVSYRVAIRDQFSILHNSGKLFLQYCVVKYAGIEGERLSFIRHNQDKLRRDKYLNVMDFVHNRAEDEHKRIGKIHILPSSFSGSPRNMYEKFQDAMAIVREFGKPDLFITFTCNPKWKEIQAGLIKCLQEWERPDLVVRVFHAKLKSLIREISEDEIFGKCAALIYAIEFQKRGLPHAHIMVSLEGNDKIRDLEIVDDIVSAEIPCPIQDKELHKIVSQHMLHGPCGFLNPSSPCMIDGQCSKRFPKSFCSTTRDNGQGYPEYKRRDTKITVIKGGKPLDNTWVVPYNRYLSRRYNAHINVEVCATVKAIKYIYKYVYKGHDACILAVSGSSNELEYDEIKSYLSGRYVSSHEALWRTLGFEMHYQSHTVIKLECHLENEQVKYFNEGEEEKALEASQKTKLLGWFDLNSCDAEAREYLYTEIPYHYKWLQVDKKWVRRVNPKIGIVSRLYTVNPKNTELFHLRLLLLHQKGATSFDDLKAIKLDGVSTIHSTFREAAIALGLTVNDNHWRLTLEEACQVQQPKNIRQLFAYIVGTNVPSSVPELWEEFKDEMSEDFVLHMTKEEAYNNALKEIEIILKTHNTSCEALNMPSPIYSAQDISSVNPKSRIINNFLSLYSQANEEQRHVINSVINAVNCKSGGVYYLDAPAGCGKTFIQTALIRKLKAERKIVLPVAFTGIAASLLEDGKTLHNQFKLPINLNETSVSGVDINSPLGKKLRNASLIIMDEASMIPSLALSVVDRLFRDLAGESSHNSKPFGGKVVLMCGDFRQILPVVPNGGRCITVEACIKSHPIWQVVEKMQLTKNMRVNEGEEEFSEFLLKVGDGKLESTTKGEDTVKLPTRLRADSLNDLINFVYPDIQEAVLDRTIADQAILTPTNDECERVNQLILERIDSSAKTYISIDSVIEDDSSKYVQYPIEFLNSVEISGLPRHKLTLKIGSVVLLMRNLDTSKGLINGTRMRVDNLFNFYIECTVLTGASAGNVVLIPRLKMCPSDKQIPFKMERLQFPLVLAFAMTINKSQGQSLKKIGLYLPKPVLTHGQLYVALSRSRSFDGVLIYIPNSANENISNEFTTRNVVFREVL